MVKHYRPPAPFIAPTTGDTDQRLAQMADAINKKADVTSIPSYHGIILLAPDGTQWQLTVGKNGQLSTEQVVQSGTAPQGSSPFNDAGRNYLHNATMRVQQRGQGPWTVPSYTADRWRIDFANDTVSTTIIAAADADRTAIGDEAALSLLQTVYTGSATANSYTQLFQRIEGVRRLGGKTITVSFWAKTAGSTPTVHVQINQEFGSGGSPSATVGAALGNVQLSATWTRYSVTAALPSTAGKTLGTNSNDDNMLILVLSDTSNIYGQGIGRQSATVQLWGIQCELGSSPSPLEKIDPQQDLAKCQRFYCTGGLFILGWAYPASAQIGSQAFFPVTMRAAPAVTWTSISDIQITAFSSGTNQNIVWATGQSAVAQVNYQINRAFTASADL